VADNIRHVRGRGIIWGAAIVAALLRIPGFFGPLHPDEAGFLLVARNWQPEPTSLYGRYWVDRPPELIALVRLSDAIGGAYFLRVVAAVACARLVLLAARTAYLLAQRSSLATPETPMRAARWTAVVTAATVGNVMIDSVSAKGEILGIPLVMAACWLALEALPVDRGRRAFALSAGSGLAASLAIGLKQNLVGGLVFGGVLLLGSALTRRISWGRFGGLAVAALAGAAVPVAATIAWAVKAGVHLSEVWYATFGFRGDANAIMASQSTEAPDARAHELIGIVLLTGMALVVVWFLASLPKLLRSDVVVAVALVLMLVADIAGVILGGSYWHPYLFNLVPDVGLAAGLVVTLPAWRGATMRALGAVTALSCVIAMGSWVVAEIGGQPPSSATYAGHAVGSSSEPGDTIVVYGGRADIVLASGLESPYRYLWSLPMRTLDPHLADLRSLLTGPDAPTWVVIAVATDSWAIPEGADLQHILDTDYTAHGDGCGLPVYLLKGLTRPPLVVDCDRPWHPTAETGPTEH
jgi:hypothetical protein